MTNIPQYTTKRPKSIAKSHKNAILYHKKNFMQQKKFYTTNVLFYHIVCYFPQTNFPQIAVLYKKYSISPHIGVLCYE